MREILFRGKRIDNGEWIEGAFYAYYDFNRTIVQILRDRTNGKPDAYEVYPETVGQYTGLTDKNGKRIFEGDIVKWNDKMGYIVFDMGCFCVKYLMPHCQNRNSPAIDIVFHEYPNEIEVIGKHTQ